MHSKNEKESLLLLVADNLEVVRACDGLSNSNFFDNVKGTILASTITVVVLIDTLLLLTPILINITILPCPLGFKPSTGDLPTCQCTDTLVNISGIENCTVTNGTGLVYRSGTVWVSHSNYSDDSVTDGVLVYKYCPYEYCKADGIAVDLYHPDTQCAFNHNGILCGGCPSNFSLALGSSRCLSCTNDGHIALLLFFITAGFALVFFIKILDLTVARGIIFQVEMKRLIQHYYNS